MWCLVVGRVVGIVGFRVDRAARCSSFRRVSTRALIILALITGMVILVAFALQVVLVL